MALRDTPGERLLGAIFRGVLPALRTLLDEGAPIDSVDRSGRTALINAVIEKNSEIVDLLISRGANVNHQHTGGWPALHFTAQAFLPEIADRLLQRGARADFGDAHGTPPCGERRSRATGSGEK